MTEQTFAGLFTVADPSLQPSLLVAFDTRMRKGEMLQRRWPQVDERDRCIRLEVEDTKTERTRVVHLTTRVVEAVKARPRDIRKLFTRACAEDVREAVKKTDVANLGQGSVKVRKKVSRKHSASGSLRTRRTLF